MPTTPLMKDDYDLFKQWGWQCGLSEQSLEPFFWHLIYLTYIAAVSIYPPDDSCLNTSCDNQIPFKKGYCKKAVVYTQHAGVQPAWNTSLYCQSEF